MKKLELYSFEEEEENIENNESEERFVCEMNYVECNRRGYCNGDC